MDESKLDSEEQEILNAFEAGDLKSVMTPTRKKAVQMAAEEALKKDKRINIHISGRDLIALQRKAAKEGIPYQTLVSSILHKYVSGHFRDKMTAK